MDNNNLNTYVTGTKYFRYRQPPHTHVYSMTILSLSLPIPLDAARGNSRRMARAAAGSLLLCTSLYLSLSPSSRRPRDESTLTRVASAPAYSADAAAVPPAKALQAQAIPRVELVLQAGTPPPLRTDAAASVGVLVFLECFVAQGGAKAAGSGSHGDGCIRRWMCPSLERAGRPLLEVHRHHWLRVGWRRQRF